jgi:hypothetical protein
MSGAFDGEEGHMRNLPQQSGGRRPHLLLGSLGLLLFLSGLGGLVGAIESGNRIQLALSIVVMAGSGVCAVSAGRLALRRSAGKTTVPTSIRFTDSGRWAMHLANQEMQRFKQEYIGTEHMLLGLIRQDKCMATKVLANLKVDLEQLREEVAKVVPHGPDMLAMGSPSRPRGKHVIEFAIEEAHNLHHDYVGTEHLLLGLVRESDGVAGHILRSAGLELAVVRQQVVKLLGGGTGAAD